jgi:NADPH:quinone reductase-like Zn-dependent oxidoreductase
VKALTIPAYGGPDVLTVADLPDPVAVEGHVLVRVRAAALQIADVALREGHLAEVMPDPSLPMTVGWEFAGAVVAVGPAAGRFAVGDPVVGLSRHFATSVGAQAELIALPETSLAPAPGSVDTVAAATLPGALTAVQALDLLGVDDGTSLLVTGGVGTVGGYALQLARLRGATVIASTSPADDALARALGATSTVDRDRDLRAQVHELLPGGVDALLDTAVVGDPALDAVRDDGRAVAVLLPAPAPRRGITPEVVFTEPDGARLGELVDLVDTGRLTLRVAATYALTQAADAHRRLAQGGLRGRLVFTL